MINHSILIDAMIKYYKGDPKRIQHFIKVHSLAKTISELEKIDENIKFILETAAIVHDIGIKKSEEKYGNCNGKNQEIEGPPVAEKLLTELGYERQVIERVMWLIAHHHTYKDIHDIDHQILVEADFLVNLYEDKIPLESIKSVNQNIFKTNTGKEILTNMFGLNNDDRKE